MRFWIFSDLHLEVQKISFPSVAPAGVDAILCAGDLCQSHQLAYWAEKIISKYNLPLILVPGNHEFFEGQNDEARSLQSKRETMQLLATASRHWPQCLTVIDDSAVMKPSLWPQISLISIRLKGGT
jgi:predicted phosphodiesterase